MCSEESRRKGQRKLASGKRVQVGKGCMFLGLGQRQQEGRGHGVIGMKPGLSQQWVKGSENIREEGDSGDLLIESHVFMKFRRTESSIL